jgi:SAM-dependent methyltransferase
MLCSFVDALNAGLRPNRRRLAARYLRGEGLEIGALHLPLPVRAGVRVRYVDRATREESIATFPELDPAAIVPVDYLTNGFTLESVADASQDFVIANHVLEHSSNPLGALASWGRVLRRDGVLFVSVPVAADCFDRLRAITTLAHLIDDEALCRAGDVAAFRAKSREHYREYIELAEPIAFAQHGWPLTRAEERAARVDLMDRQGDEIHFHTFTRTSLAELARHFAGERFEVLRVEEHHQEIAAILCKG